MPVDIINNRVVYLDSRAKSSGFFKEKMMCSNVAVKRFSNESENLPVGIAQTESGLVVGTDIQIGDHAMEMGSFDRVLIYPSKWVNGLVGEVEVGEILKYHQSFDNITLLENNVDAKKDMVAYRKAYVANFVFGFLPTLKNKLNTFGDQELSTLAPQRGGEPILEMIHVMQSMGYFENVHIPKFEAKRMFLKDGSSALGISGLDFSQLKDIVLFIDDCLASNLSATGVMDSVIDEKKGGPLTMSLVVGFGYVKAFDRLKKRLQQRADEDDKHFLVEPTVSRRVFNTNQDHYLTIAEHEKEKFPNGDQVVGDMGMAMNLFTDNKSDNEELKKVIWRVVKGVMGFDDIQGMTNNLIENE